jgi:glutathione synthase/RimK-type ligase-like ATP-grasp enzyme
MAKDHWQIYNWSSSDDGDETGGFETLSLESVPKKVIDTALAAANVVGDGLYGVDLKEIESEPYVIEVNDNPSIDHEVEDLYLGDALYRMIMQSFYNRLENAREIIRPIS